MRYNTITAIGTFTALNGSVANSLMLVPERCTGGADAPLRTTVEDAPSQDGALIEPPLDGAQIITLGGYFDIESGDRFTGSDTLLARPQREGQSGPPNRARAGCSPARARGDGTGRRDLGALLPAHDLRPKDAPSPRARRVGSADRPESRSLREQRLRGVVGERALMFARSTPPFKTAEKGREMHTLRALLHPLQTRRSRRLRARLEAWL